MRPRASAPRALIRGGGELASAVAHALFRSGFRVAVLETPSPLAVRRLVSFSQAVLAGCTRVEGVEGRRIEPGAVADLDPSFVTVLVDPGADCLRRLRVEVLVDARMLKRRGDTRPDQAPCVVGLGPGFVAGDDVHAVVETRRGPRLGSVIWHGSAEPDDGLPGDIGGETARRVLRAPVAGVFRGRAELGTLVREGTLVGEVGDRRIVAPFDGRLRGLLADATRVEAGLKVGDVDPRGAAVDPARISDKGQAVAAGVLEAVRALLPVAP
jgi:xanthine dehydrogenase accessory factor